MTYTLLPHRTVIAISGLDRVSFLNGLVSNDVVKVVPGNAIYACFLTPQGKFLHDFIIFADADTLYLTPETERVGDLLRRLKLYKLRSDVSIEHHPDLQLVAVQSADDISGIHAPDPRHAAMGSLALVPAGEVEETYPFNQYDEQRIRLGIPDGSRDMLPERGILLENNVDACNGIDWDKGCYLGQELTARTKYRGLVRKQLTPVSIDGEVPTFDTPLLQSGKEVGLMRSVAGDIGLAMIHLEKTDRSVDFETEEGSLVRVLPQGDDEQGFKQDLKI